MSENSATFEVLRSMNIKNKIWMVYSFIERLQRYRGTCSLYIQEKDQFSLSLINERSVKICFIPALDAHHCFALCFDLCLQPVLKSCEGLILNAQQLLAPKLCCVFTFIPKEFVLKTDDYFYWRDRASVIFSHVVSGTGHFCYILLKTANFAKKNIFDKRDTKQYDLRRTTVSTVKLQRCAFCIMN
jgi:hypothetical protein